MRAFTVAAALIGAVSASPGQVSDYIASALDVHKTSGEPCALVAKALASDSNSSLGGGSLLDAALAYQCLESVPLHEKDGIQQVEGVRIFTQFQSTVAYLKTPPQGYLYPALDVFAAYDQITDKLKNGGYSSEYDFQIDLTGTIMNAHDGHFAYLADITQVFQFLHHAMVSISEDGVSVPQVYLERDILNLGNNTLNTTTISSIAQINGEDVEQWINRYAAVAGGNQDPDANYNTILQPGGGSYYLGPMTTFLFNNGTSTNVTNYAMTQANFAGVTDGISFFNTFCSSNSASSSSAIAPAPSTTTFRALSTSQGLPTVATTEVPFTAVPSQTAIPDNGNGPTPYVINDDGSVAGFYPDFDDELAVLQISSFDPADGTQFANIVREFLATSNATGKTKLIVDLSRNGGGDVNLAYDTFAQLFPGVLPFGASNTRATPLVNNIGTIVSGFYSNVTNTTENIGNCSSDFDFGTVFNYREQFTVNNTRFTSWGQLFGPHKHNGDNFTSLTRYNLDDYFSLCSNISNYGNLTNIDPVRVFEPENITLVQDGACASTCAIFTEFMKTQENVTQVAFGGRPQTGPMQGVGGVKGAQSYSFQDIANQIAEAATDDATPSQQAQFNTLYGNLTDAMVQAIVRAGTSPTGSLLASINYRNNIRQGDDDATPLQFVYEAADCRLFYTLDMIRDLSFVWEAAEAVVWGNASCVEGSTGSLSTGLGVDNVPPPSARNFFGADVVWSVMDTDVWKPSSRSSSGGGSSTSGVESLALHCPPLCVAAMAAGFFLFT